MVKRLNQLDAREVILAVMPCFEKEFSHFAPVDAHYLADSWCSVMDCGGLAYGLEIDDEWRGFLLGSILPDMVSGKLQGLEFFWLVEKAYRGENSKQLLDLFEADCKIRGAEWVVVGMSQLAQPEKRKKRYTQLGYGPHCETWMKRL